jgi:hypothetical protein
MLKAMIAALVLSVVTTGQAKKSAEQGRSNNLTSLNQSVLWAAISVQQPIYFEGGTDTLQINFGVVNDGPSTVNPKIESSRLFGRHARSRNRPCGANVGSLLNVAPATPTGERTYAPDSA